MKLKIKSKCPKQESLDNYRDNYTIVIKYEHLAFEINKALKMA